MQSWSILYSQISQTSMVTTMENEAPEVILRLEIESLMQRFGITIDDVFRILTEMEMIDDTYTNDRPWLDSF